MNTKITRLILLSALSSLLIVVCFNYLVDPFGVFRTGLLKDLTINERYRKMDYLLNHPDANNAFLLGSSIVGLFNPETATEISGTGVKYYNLAYLGGTTNESYQSILALESHGVNIKEAIVGIDLFNFRDTERPYGESDHPHPVVIGESRTRFFSSYLFASSFYQGIIKLLRSFQSTPDIRFYPDTDGRYELVRYNKEIAQNHAMFIQQHLANTRNISGIPVWIPKRFEDFQNLVDLLKRSNIHTKYFIHPFNHHMTDEQSPEMLQSFRQRIKAIVPDVYDFSDYQKITKNDCFYYDDKHYLPIVADKIMEAILKNDRDPNDIQFPESVANCTQAHPIQVTSNNQFIGLTDIRKEEYAK